MGAPLTRSPGSPPGLYGLFVFSIESSHCKRPDRGGAWTLAGYWEVSSRPARSQPGPAAVGDVGFKFERDGISAMPGPIRALHACALAPVTNVETSAARRDRLTSDRCMTPGGALPENPTLRVNRAVPAFGAEIFESTCSTVQQHTPRYLCSTKYHTPIHGAPRAPVRRSLPSAYARNKRGENNSRRSRRCRVTAPFADPSRTAEILRSPVIFTRLLVVFGVASISRWPNPPATACASYLEDLAKSSVLL